MTDNSARGAIATGGGDLGPNAGLVDEMYRLYQENPRRGLRGLARVLRRLPAPRRSAPTTAARRPRPPTPRPAARPRRRPRRHRPRPGRPPPRAATGRARSSSPARRPSRSAARRRASSPTWKRASRCRPPRRCARCPAKLLEVNRQILNNHLARAHGGKVSFTHLIGFAVLRALRTVPAMNSSFGVVDGKPSVVHHEHVNLGLAIDLQKSDGTRTLIVPNIKQADTLDFASFHAAYEDLIRRARTNKLTPDDLAARPSRSPTRARSARCTRCRASCPARA